MKDFYYFDTQDNYIKERLEKFCDNNLIDYTLELQDNIWFHFEFVITKEENEKINDFLIYLYFKNEKI